ncbi:leucine efflux protein LeuE [Streptomyces sp. LP05-1]|uniref:Leucine efflux protein LeuE n=1 Tax=Streptomyces pyxinae TaxID=2970734 RepID=A0ABT2CK66_9ACTN|nr:leucine efflux protein LeuE [Streptomyces sp. LP05-1]MCS0637695.1 leucine efflux protein LeuE [Streptomyces sp. LP05-1]
MLGVTDLPTYLAGLALVVLLPGPNSLYVLSVAARRGVRPGYVAASGVWCGDTVLMTLSAAGVASLLQANALLFGIVKYAGAGYLTWLAFGMLRAAWVMWRSRRDRADAAEGTAAAATDTTTAGIAATGTVTGASMAGTGATAGTGAAAGSARPSGPETERPFRRAFVVSLLNPKAILFFVAFFVQFVDPAYQYPALSFVLLGTLAQAASVLYLSLLIFSGTRLAAAFRRRRRLSAGATSAAGALFLGFAVKLSLASGV